MTSKTTKSLLFAIIATVTISSIAILTTDVIAEEHLEIAIASDPTNEGWLKEDGNRSIVSVNFDNEDVLHIASEKSNQIAVTLTHVANNENVKPVVLKPFGTLGITVPESFANLYTSEERAEQFRTTGKLVGGISLSDYTIYEESLITLPVNESVKIMMYVDIPEEIQRSLNDSTIPFQPAFEIIDGENVKIDNNILDLKVIPGDKS